MTSFQSRITNWVSRVFSPIEAADVRERALRAAEEVVELAQSCGVDRFVLHRLVDYVYGRPNGDPRQELAQSMVCIYAAAAALGADVERELEIELARIEKPDVIARIQRRQREKRETMYGANQSAPIAMTYVGLKCMCGKPAKYTSGWCGDATATSTCYPLSFSR